MKNQELKDQLSVYGDLEYYYRFSHAYDHEPATPVYLESKVQFHTMEVLVAYLQFECSDIEESFDLGQENLANILVKFFDGKIVTADLLSKSSYEIDLYLNWEEWCSMASIIQEMELFERDGLKDYLRELVEKETGDRE